MAGLSLLLVAAGAVMAFAVSDRVEGVDLIATGYILMIVGGIGLLASLFSNTFGGVRSRTERTVNPDGRTVVEQTETKTR